MTKSRSAHARLVLLIAFVSSILSLGGCSDESKTSGTQVTISKEVEARRKAKAESYKGGPPKRRAKVADKKN